MKKLKKKFIAIVLLIITLFNAIPVSTFASTFITNMNSDATFGVISGSYASYGHELHYATYDGQTYLVFCTEQGVTSPDGSSYSYNSDFTIQYKDNLSSYQKIAEMIYFGYTMKYGTSLPSTTEAIKAACCTQQYVWEYIHNNIDSTAKVPSRDSWVSIYMSSSIYSSWLSQTESSYNSYHTDVNFTSNKVDIGKTTTITDSSGELANYTSFTKTINGVTFAHESGSNSLNITVSSNCEASSVTFNSEDYGYYKMVNGKVYDSSTMSNYLYFKFASGSVQDLMFSNYIDAESFSFSVDIQSGNVLIVKTNSNGDNLAGCTFGLYSDSNCTNQIDSGVSNSNGEISFTKLSPGTYYIKEIAVPSGYLIDSSVKSVTVTSGNTATVTFVNSETTGKITLTKIDSDIEISNRIDGTAHHGDASLKGAVYTLYANSDIYNASKTIKYFSANEEIATFTFDENGVATAKITNTSTKAGLNTNGATVTGLPMGTYYAMETTVPTGYTKDENKYTLTLSYKDNSTSVVEASETVKNTVQKAKFEVIKISSNTNDIAEVIEGAEFTAILTKYVDYYGSFDEALKHLDEFAEDEYSVFTTGSNGHGTSGYLAYGKYTVNETYTPEGVNKVKEFYVTINQNSSGVIKELVANDTPFESYLKIVKKDAETGKLVTYSNAVFCLYKYNEGMDSWDQVSCKVGNIYNTSWITSDEGYAVTENKLEAGTYKISELQSPNGYLSTDDVIFEISSSSENLEYDSDGDAWIVIEINDEKPTGTLEITKLVNLREDADFSMIEDIDLTQIYFKLVANENILDPADGSIIFEEGEEIGTYNFDEYGNIIIEELPLGSYYIQEVATLEGVALDETKYEVNIEQEDLTTKNYILDLHIENYTTFVEISKTDITGEKELEGATLQVLDIDENVVNQWISSSETHKIEGLKVGETYILREVIAVDGYVKSSDIEFTIENTGEVQKVTMIDKLVEIQKIDEEGNVLEGARLEIVDENGVVIDNWLSTDEVHYAKNLEEGKTYTLVEVRAPEGYELSDDIEFTVSFDKETQIIEMIDLAIQIEIEETPEPEPEPEPEIEEPEPEPVEEPEPVKIQEEVIQTGNERNIKFYFETMIIAIAGIIMSLKCLKRK